MAKSRLPAVGRYTTSYFRLDMTKLQRLERDAPEFAHSTAKDMAETLIDHIKSNWSPISPSSPYNPPAKVTGTLESNLRYVLRDALGRFVGADTAVSFSIYDDIEYAAALEFGHKRNSGAWIEPRPYFRPAIEWFKATYPNTIYMSWSRWLKEDYGDF